VIGRNPDPALVAEAKRRGLAWLFTGYVDDVRPHLEGTSAYVIPLRVGGGTRIKAYEAMAFGLPTVSTAIGIEGLSVQSGKHYLEADTAEAFAAATVSLLRDQALRQRLATDARALVEQSFSARSVGIVFEAICVAAMEAHRLRGESVNGNPAQTPGRGTSAA
jgi:glycosyltransferase involved in cell wall biosynthesis